MSNENKRKQDKPLLVFTFGLMDGEQFLLDRTPVVIGRDPSADICLDSPFVSRQHARIEYQGGYWFITDLFSKNGVFRNLDRIQPGKQAQLNHRDQVQVGSVSAFEFHDPQRTIQQSEIRILARGLRLDISNREVYIHGEPLEPLLPPQQFTLLAVLVRKDGKVVTNREIAQTLWPDAAGGVESAAIDNAISRLRDRLAELDPTHDYIETVRGVGRRFVQRDDQHA